MLNKSQSKGVLILENYLTKTLSLLSLSALLLGACGGGDESDQPASDVESDESVGETASGSADGYAGELNVEVAIEDGKIESIETNHQETGSIGGAAIESLTEQVINNQSVNLDTVSGATVTSDAFLAAVASAIEAAGLSVEQFNEQADTSTDEVEDQETDVVVIGAGGAGLTAAIEAAEAGADVIVLEKMPIIGGNTNKATGGMNASETTVQEELGIEDSNEVFFQDTLEGGHGLNDEELLSTMVEESSEALDWLNSLDTNLNDVSFSGGATNPRIHKPEDGSPVGPLIIEKLHNHLQELDVPIMLESEVVQINREDDIVTGVEVQTLDGSEFTVSADAVIIATGGFGANSDLIAEFDQTKAQFNSTNHEGADGSGIEMGEELGAGTVDMEQIQTHPTTNPENGDLYTEGVRGDGGILVNKEGERFIDELETRDVVSEAIINQTDSIAYLTVSQNIADDNKSLQGYIDNGHALEGETIEDLAAEIDVDSNVLEETIQSYNDAVANGEDPEHGRTSFSNALAEGPFFAIPVTPGIHHTMGGLTITSESEVLNTNEEVIPGLYAAGEVTGGIHGGNRIGGNAVLDIVVFGRIAGQNAAEFVGASE